MMPVDEKLGNRSARASFMYQYRERWKVRLMGHDVDLLKGPCEDFEGTINPDGLAIDLAQLADIGAFLRPCIRDKLPSFFLSALVEVHGVATRLLVLHKLEILCAQSERLQYAVPKAFQLAHHLRHLLVLCLIESRS